MGSEIMGIYYYAVDTANKLIIEPLDQKSNKFPGIINPYNPFSAMVVMKNAMGFCFEIVNDMGSEPWLEENYKDVTLEVYQELLRIIPWAKDFYESELPNKEEFEEDLKNLCYSLCGQYAGYEDADPIKYFREKWSPK